MKEKIKTIIKEITLERVIKLTIIFTVLLIGFAIFYHYVISPSQRLEHLNECLLGTELSYYSCWNSHCEILGKEKDCNLPVDHVDRCKEQRKEDKDYCFKKYPQK